MDEEKRLRPKQSSEVDRLSVLPDYLLCEILSNLPTKDVVKSSVLSKRWSNLWRFVPGLKLKDYDFPEYDDFVRFVDSYLDLNNKSCFQNLKLRFDADRYVDDMAHVTSWINNVVERKIQHLHVGDYSMEDDEIHIPPTIPPTVYKCQYLVSLKLYSVILADTEFVSLPLLRVIDMNIVKFANDSAVEKLILGCPVLGSFTIRRSYYGNVEVLRICSKSLLSITHITKSNQYFNENKVVGIDAPKLKYLRLSELQTVRFSIPNNPMSIAKVHIGIKFQIEFDPDDLQKGQIIRNILDQITGVKDMIISSTTLLDLYSYSKLEPLPKFCNLSNLHARFTMIWWDVLPAFLESCPNLKFPVVFQGFNFFLKGLEISHVLIPQCFISSLEFLEIETPLIGDVMEIKLVSYFLENSAILKKLTLRLDCINRESVILKELNAIPRLSSKCQVLFVD